MPSATTCAPSSSHRRTIDRDQALLARAPGQAGDQAAVELDDLGREVGDVLEVRVAGAEVVDDEANAPRARTSASTLWHSEK